MFRSAYSTDEVLARIDNYKIYKTVFEKAVFILPEKHLEMRRDIRII